VLHEFGPESRFSGEVVVRATYKTQVIHRGLSAFRHGNDVVVLQASYGGAALPVLANDRALAAVVLPHRAAHVRRDVARAASGARAARRLCGAALSLLGFGAGLS